MIELNGKKINKIMLGNKEVMSSGVNLKSWIDKVTYSAGWGVSVYTKETNNRAMLYDPIIIPKGSKKIVFYTSKAQTISTQNNIGRIKVVYLLENGYTPVSRDIIEIKVTPDSRIYEAEIIDGAEAVQYSTLNGVVAMATFK